MKPSDPTDKKQDSKVQGEGDYKSDKRYTESVQSFVKSGKVEEAARKAKPASEQEAAQLKKAEERGLAHNKGEDPSLQHSPPRKP